MRVEIADLGIIQELGDYKLIKELEGNRINRKFESNVKFSGEDYKLLLQQTMTGKGLQEVTAYEMCGPDEIAIQCNLLHNEGRFDDKTCTYQKKLFIKDPLTCIKDLEVNIFDYSASSIGTIKGVKEEMIYSNVKNLRFDENETPQLDYLLSELGGIPDHSNEGWKATHISIYANPIGDTYTEEGHTYTQYVLTEAIISVTYTRVKSTTKYSVDWLPIPSIAGSYYLSTIPNPEWLAPVYGFANYTALDGSTTQYVSAVYEKGKVNFVLEDNISNCIDFKEMIEDIFSCSGLGLISNFFGINSDNTQPNNEFYEYALYAMQDLKICQSFDIIREEALQDSFGKSGKLKAKKFIEEISIFYNLILMPDTVANVLRWEHVTYSNTIGIDFTTNGVDYGVDDEYEVNKELVSSETWRMAAITPNGYETKIIYDVIGETIDKEVVIEQLLTDVVGTINNSQFEGSEYKNKFYLLQTDGEYLIELNTGMQIEKIVKKFHYINRVLPKGIHDGVNVSFSGYSLGITNTISYEGSLKDLVKFNPTNSAKIKSGTFMITSIEYDGSKTKIKIKK